MSTSENFTSYAARWSATHGKGVVRGWLAFVLVVACSPRWLTRQAALLPGGSCARVLGLAASAGASAKARSRARGGVHRLRVLCGLASLACGVLLMLAALPPQALASTNWATGVEASLPANAGKNPDAGFAPVWLGVVRLGGELHRRRRLRRQLGPRTGAAVERDVGHVGDRRQGAAARKRRHKPGRQPRPGVVRLGGELHRRRHLRRQLRPPGAAFDRDLGEVGDGRRGVAARKRRHEQSGRGLFSVSCASAGNCTAVGDYDASSDREQGLLLTETSGRWATGVEASLPANAAQASRTSPLSRCRAPRRGTAPPSAPTPTLGHLQGATC